MANKGFFVPNSMSSSYVANDRLDSGALAWQSAENEIGLDKQLAYQALNTQYATTINNAYANYVNAQRGVQGSAMGQGYKEAYLQAQDQGLQQQVAQANTNAASIRQDLDKSENNAKGELQKAFETEVSNMDRTQRSLGEYLNYVKSLTSADGSQTFLNAEEMTMDLDNMYERLYGTGQQNFVDMNGQVGMSYLQWANSQLKDTAMDREWAQWLFGLGGYQKFQQASRAGINR